jgi:hypothetical protein
VESIAKKKEFCIIEYLNVTSWAKKGNANVVKFIFFSIDAEGKKAIVLPKPNLIYAGKAKSFKVALH